MVMMIDELLIAASGGHPIALRLLDSIGCRVGSMISIRMPYHWYTSPLQGIMAINKSIETRAFHSKPVLLQAFKRAQEVSGGRVHFLGLVSDGGVHSHISHLEAFLEAAKMAGVGKAFVHFFSDGRDTSPVSGGEEEATHLHPLVSHR